MFKQWICCLFAAGTVFGSGVVLEKTDSETVFTAFDTETTGFCYEEDRVVEIGAVKFCGDGTVLASTNWLVNPQCAIPSCATEVHGITDEMAANAPVFFEVWKQFEVFCGDSVLLAHNAAFDVGFLNAELERVGMEVPVLEVVDTLPLFRRWFPDAPGHSLEKLAGLLGVDAEHFHRAGVDSMAIVQVFCEGVKRLGGVKLYADDYIQR